MLSDNDLIRVQEVSQKMTRPVTLCVNLTGDQNIFETNLANIARQLQGVSLERIMIEEGGVSLFPGKPCLTLSNGEHSNINYMVFPEGPEFPPFLDAIGWLGGASNPPVFPDNDKIKNLATPRNILVFVAMGCPHCPETVKSVLTVANYSQQINVSVIDALNFPEISERYKIKSTPAIIINEGLTLVGDISVNDLARHLIVLDDDSSMTTILLSMIQSGRAEDAAVLLCERECPDAIVPIYLSKEFSRRMGALLVMEEALDRNPAILDPILDRLIDLLQSDDIGLRGDTASLLGRIGSKSAVSGLERATDDPDPDVREAAREALEKCRR
ncbi:MAG: thioredoxin family protein [Deltaproteobacteria bacterium]|nr:thioredoxin family protein [Deltaproteobacteria bacterium]